MWETKNVWLYRERIGASELHWLSFPPSISLHASSAYIGSNSACLTLCNILHKKRPIGKDILSWIIDFSELNQIAPAKDLPQEAINGVRYLSKPSKPGS